MLLVGPPMPDRSRVMTQMKRDTLVLQAGGWVSGQQPHPIKIIVMKKKTIGGQGPPRAVELMIMAMIMWTRFILCLGLFITVRTWNPINSPVTFLDKNITQMNSITNFPHRLFWTGALVTNKFSQCFLPHRISAFSFQTTIRLDPLPSTQSDYTNKLI